MRKSVRSFLIKSGLVALALSLNFFAACEIGLGSSVDTEAPVISISYPPSLSVIRDSFVLSGTWSDDNSIKTVNVDVYQSVDEGKNLVYSDKADISKDGTWSIELNKFDKDNPQYFNGWQYVDGDYEIQVKAVDHAKHSSGISSRSFSIDNSAPVLVITNPTTAGNDATPAAFGQIVQLKGSFYDFCGKLAKLTVTFYDETGKAICDSSFSNITDMSDANPLTVARYYANDADRNANSAIYNNYKALFGAAKLSQFEQDNPITSSKIYFTVTANDNAKQYKTVGDEGTGDGNVTTLFYRGTTSMQNLVSGNGAIENFSLVDFASFLNKTSTKHSAYSSTINSIAASAKSYSSTEAETPSIAGDISNTDSSNGNPVYLTCTLNPKNNPQYVIGGYEIVAPNSGIESYSSKGFKNVYQNSPVPLNITVGSDNRNISTHTVSFYLIDTDYNNFPGIASINASTFTEQHDWVELLHTWDETVYNRYRDWNQNISERYTPSSEDANVSSISKQFSITSFVPTHNYLFYVVGQDITGNEILAVDDKGYGFCGTVSATAPTISILSGNKLNEVVSGDKFYGTKAGASQLQLTDLLYLSGEISSGEPVTEFKYTLKVTESSDSATPRTLSKDYTINIEELDAAPDTSDLTKNYCYTIKSSSTPIKYFWRIATKPVANDFASVITTAGSYDISLEIKAYNGANASTQRTFTLDTKAPEAELSDISVSAPAQGGGYWVNPAKAYTIKGLVTDNLSTANACKTWIVLKALGENGAETSTKYSTDNNKVTGVKTWEFTIPANTIDSTYAGANLYIYSEDVAGNQGVIETPIKLYFDTVAPKGIHKVDYFNKDIVFRVSDFDNAESDVAITNGCVSYSTALDKDVGGKYLKGSYSNSSTLKIRGYFKEEGSGVDMIYYKVFATKPTSNDINNFETDYNKSGSANKATGSFKPLETPEEKQVMFQTGATDNDWYGVKVKSSFNETITGLDNPNNYLVLLAVDKVGNVAVDTLDGEWIKHEANDPVCSWKESSGGNVVTTAEISAWNDSLKAFSLNVDQESPILECTSHSGQQFTNGVAEIEVSGKFTDNPKGKCSGVSYISITVNGIETKADITPKATDDYSEGTWSVTIPTTTLTTLEQGKTYNANGTIKDKAGNSSSATLFTLSMDKVAPTVKVETPAKGTKVNGSISMSGSVEYDAAAPKTLEIYAQKTVPSGEITGTPVITITDPAKIYSWKVDAIDTYGITGVEDNPTTAEIYIIPVVTDSAGNKNIYDLTTSSYKYEDNKNYFKYTVDMDTDRPTVKVTNLTNTGTEQAPVYILKYGENAKIEGSVSDDDSTSEHVVKQFIASDTEISASSITKTGNEYNPITGVGTTNFTPSTGEWSFTPSDTDDGGKTVYFYIVDNNDTLFYTGKVETVDSTEYKYHQPKFQCKTSPANDNSEALSYNSDKTPPDIGIKVQAYKSDNTANGEKEAVTANTRLGGSNKKYAGFEITASDANQIDRIRLTIKDKKYISKAPGTDDSGFVKNGNIDDDDDDTTTIWTTEKIDVSSWTTGNVTVTVEAYDKSGLLATASPTFFVDNAGPAINITSPKSTDEITGKLTISGTSTDEGGAGSATIDFIVPTKVQRTSAGNTPSSKETYYKKTLADSAWGGNLHADSTVSAFRYDFDGDTTNENALFDVYTKDDSAKTWELTPNDNGIYTVPIIFRSKDSLGNVSIKEYSITYNPDGDKPKTEITYPSAANYEAADKQYVTLGGEIRVTGSVSIPSLTTTPERVYLQIAAGKTEDAFTAGKTKAEGTGTGNYGYTVKTLSDVGIDIGKSIQGIIGTAATNWWGIQAVRSSNAWSISLNSDSELDPSGSEPNEIYIRACGVNAEGKMGTWSEPVCIHVDASAPTYTTKLYQFTGTPSAGSQTAEKDYVPGIYLRGQWYLGLHIEDDDKVTIASVKEGGTSGTPLPASDITKIGEGTTEAYLFIKLDANATTTKTYTVSAHDEAEGNKHYIYPSYDINIDNTAPELSAINSGEGYPLEMTKQRTSNKVMTFGATATDTGSGFSRLAYYFKRGTSIEVPLPTAENEDQKKWKVGSAYTGTLTETDDDLYGVELTGTGAYDEVNNKTTFTNDSVGTTDFIRKGGIVKLAGTYHLITKVSGNVVTVDGKIDSAIGNNKKAFFPAALIVDNTSAESSTWLGGINTIAGDDGDGVTESVKKSGATWTWDTSIYAGELDDGEVTLVCVAFDVAENAAKRETTFMLTNKTPRLSKLYLATDLTGDGKYSDNELGTSVITASGSKTVEKYYSALNEGSLQEVFTVYGNETDESNSETESGITMRDKLGLAFEFISGYEGYGAGQDALKYKLTVGDSALNVAQTGTSLPSLATATESNYDKTDNTVTKTLIGKKFLEIPTTWFRSGATVVNTYGTYTEDALNYLRITLWDSSNDKAGTADGTKTTKSYKNSNGDTAYYDTYASFGAQWTAFNIPLYMDLVDGVPPTVEIDNPVALGTEDAPEGHVDLKATLSSLTGSKEFDSDDKVSGKIKFTGTINDDKRIDYINLTVNKNFSAKEVSAVRLATYVPSTGGFKVGTAGAAVTIGGTTPTAIVPNSATGLTFRLLSNEFSTKAGHTVTWELEVDTELVASLAQTDVVFTVTANDKTNTTNKTHKVDIVPYIASFKRSTTLTDTHRSRLGKYQVVLGESVNITGWNLPGDTENAIKLQTTGNQSSAAGTVKKQLSAATGSTKNAMSFTAPDNSGYIKVVTNGVSSVNNFNSGNAVEGENDSDEWNDDIYLNVWKNNEYFAGSPDPISPAMDRIAANKKNNTYNANVYTLYGGWAANSSKFFASYPDSTSTAATGNATAPSTGNFGDPASYYDVVIDSSGNLYHCLLDCWQGQNGNGQNYQRGYWGRNFVINKNGSYTHNGTNASTDATTDNIIERMGWNTLPEYETHENGYDAMFNQFLNPRITYKNNYAYLTYYDRYAKCLKFASMQFNANGNNRTNKYSTEGGNYANGKFVVAGYETLQSGGTKSAMDVGIWSSIVVDSETGKTDSPVIAYYDTKNKQLMIATAKTRSQHPENNNNNVLANGTTQTAPTGGTTPGEGNAWKHTAVTGSANYRLGQYVSMAIDGGMNLHIAAYGTAKGNKLYYIYGKKNSYGDYTFTTTVVDEENAGTWTDIQLEAPTASGAAAKPVISYYDPSNDSSENAVKVAYLDNGVWDTMTAPLASSAVSNRITLALDVTDGDSITKDTTTNNSKLAVGYVSSRFDCVYLRKE